MCASAAPARGVADRRFANNSSEMVEVKTIRICQCVGVGKHQFHHRSDLDVEGDNELDDSGGRLIVDG